MVKNINRPISRTVKKFIGCKSQPPNMKKIQTAIIINMVVFMVFNFISTKFVLATNKCNSEGLQLIQSHHDPLALK